MSFKGRFNRYTCESCGFIIHTVDLDEGVTPYIIRCRHGDCDGVMRSHMYRVTLDQLPDYEWYRPSEEEIKGLGLDTGVLEHVRSGGLMLRQRGD